MVGNNLHKTHLQSIKIYYRIHLWLHSLHFMLETMNSINDNLNDSHIVILFIHNS
ncbi:protein of unknown function [Latilactobacillus sakei]|nr:protein of unknown function [Latilactobacillus sakei]